MKSTVRKYMEDKGQEWVNDVLKFCTWVVRGKDGNGDKQ